MDSCYISMDHFVTYSKNMIDLRNKEFFDWEELKKKIRKTIAEHNSNTYNRVLNAIVDYMNQFMAVLTDYPQINTPAYAFKTLKEGYVDVNILTINQLKNNFKNKKVNLNDLPNVFELRKESRDIFTLWDNHPNRLEYKNIVFDPGMTQDPNQLNVYTGFQFTDQECEEAYKDEKALDAVDSYLEHISEIICNGKKDMYEYIKKWLAHKMQRPYEKLHTTIILSSMEGAGKGVFVYPFSVIYSKNFVKLTSMKQITNRFNSILSECLLCFCDEIYSSGTLLF